MPRKISRRFHIARSVLLDGSNIQSGNLKTEQPTLKKVGITGRKSYVFPLDSYYVQRPEFSSALQHEGFHRKTAELKGNVGQTVLRHELLIHHPNRVVAIHREQSLPRDNRDVGAQDHRPQKEPLAGVDLITQNLYRIVPLIGDCDGAGHEHVYRV